MRCLALFSAGACGLLALSTSPVSAQADAAGTYPVCTVQMQDGCQNPGEGGAPGRSRASDYSGGPAAYAAGTAAHARHHAAPRKKMRRARRT